MSGPNVGRNAAWLMAATALNKLIAFATFALVAKITGPTVTGTFFFGVSVTSVFVILSDLGMTPVVIRAISGSREDGGRLLGATLRMKLWLIPIAVLASLSYGFLRHTNPQTFWTIAVACGVMTADAMHLVLYGAIRGKQNLRPEAIGMLVGQIATSAIAASVALIYPTPVGLAFALLAGSLWNAGWALTKVRAANIAIESPRRTDFARLAREAVPFGIAGLAVKVYSYVDSLLIEAFHGATSVGYYAVAYKMTYALQFLPLTFSAALYPALSKQYADKDADGLRRTLLGSMRFLAAIGFPLSAGLSALAPQIITIVYGHKFSGSIAAFSILPWVLLPIFMDFSVGAFLNATHKAHLKTSAQVCTMVVNVILNVLLVPKYGPLGAAWAGVASFWILLFVGFAFARKSIGGIGPMINILVRAFASAALSWYVWRWSATTLSVFASAAIGSVVAISAAFGLGLVTKADIGRILGMLHRRPRGDEENIHADS